MNIKKQFMRIVTRHTILLLIVLFIIVAVAVTRQELDRVYLSADSLGHIVADELDGDELEEYARTLKKDEHYEQVKSRLQQIKTRFPNCISLYIFVPDGTDKATYVYDIYTKEEYETRNVDEGDLGFMEDFTRDVLGYAVELFETGEEIKELDIDLFNKYGSLASIYLPVYNNAGQIKGIIGIDYSILSIVLFVAEVLGVMLVFFVVFGGLFGIYELNTIQKKVIKPIDTIQEKVSEYVTSEHNGNSEKFMISINENSENELDILGKNMNEMMHDMDEFIIQKEKDTRENQRIASELDLASKIQSSYLPNRFPAFPDRKDFDIYATMNPAKEVGGDFYDFFLIDDSHLGIVIADVSGKGIGAALFMMISKTMLNDQAMFTNSPAEVLRTVNNRLCAINEAEMFVTVWLGVLDLDTGLLRAANAGHEFPTLKKSDGDFELIKDKHGFVLAGMENSIYSEYEIQLGKGDIIFVYTDGVAEATNAEEELFGNERIVEALNKSKDEPVKNILVNMRKEIDDFVKEAPQFDDITMLGLQYFGK